MGRSTMLVSVLQALALNVASEIALHCLLDGTTSKLPDWGHIFDYEPPGTNETFSSRWSAREINIAVASPEIPAKSYWRSDLPYAFAEYAIILPLQYFWCLMLERWLPRRPHMTAGPIAATAADEKSTALLMRGEDGDGAEEDVVKRWIARGRVRRSSLSWPHVFAQWFLELTVGNAWRTLASAAIGYVFNLGDIRDEPFSGLCVYLGFRWIAQTFAPMRIATLVGLIIVPAHKRIVFEAGAELVWSLFVAAFLRTIVPWVMQLEWIQELLINIRNDARAELLRQHEAAKNATHITAPLIEHEL